MALNDFLNNEVNGAKWNKMWDMWMNGTESPYTEIMSYYSEVNSGGHYGFFDLSDFRSDPDLREATVEILKNALPDLLSECVAKGYEAYLALEEGTDDEDEYDDILAECDDIFYDNDSMVEDILAKYAETIEL